METVVDSFCFKLMNVMQTFLLISQVVISIALTALILMQNKDGGLSAVMGGGGDSFQTTRRGAEKVIFNATIVLSVLFLVNAFAFVLI